jgi:hypothetical protein
LRLKIFLVRFAALGVCLNLAWLTGCTSAAAPAPVPPVTVAVTAAFQTIDAGQAVTVSANITNDTANRGVQWTLTCSGGNCGALSNQTNIAATYTAATGLTANAPVTITATSLASPTVASSVTVTGVPLPSVPVGTGTLNPPPSTGSTGVAFSYKLQNAGGVAPFQWAVTAGSLPPGLSLAAATGVIAGTPTAGGSYSATVQVTDSGSPAKTASAVVPFVIVPPLSVATSSLPSGNVNTAYSTTLAATNGTSPYKWSLAAGALPAGVTLSSTGVISGTPTASGSFPITVAVQDSASPVGSASASLTLVVSAAAPVTITTTAPPAGTVGNLYSTTLLASGGTTASYQWSLVSGALPPGVLLDGVAQGNTAGQLLGVPTSAGTYTFTVQATGSASATASVSITIAPQAGTNNSLLKGHYAFYLSGFTDPDSCTPTPNPIADQPMMMVGSFVADGVGNISSGLYDSYVCGTSTTLHAFSGTYSVGADGRGRMVMTNVANGQSTFAFSVAQVVSGVAQQAQFIEFDDVSEDYIGSRGSGVMQMQDTTAFATAKLNGSFVYGLTGPGPAAGLWTFNGAGVIGGPSATGSYGSPDTVSGRTTMTVNGTSYVMYIVNQQQAFLSTTGNALAASGISVGQTRLQQSSSFSNASINGSLVAYGLTPPPSGSYAGGGLLDILSGNGAGNLTGTQDIGSHYGTTPIAATYSVSSNGLVLLGTGDVIWLYATNAGFSVPASLSNALLTYENAAGGPYTFDTSTGYSVGSVPPRNGEINLLNGSAAATDYSSEDFAGSQPLGLSTTSTGQTCAGCAHSAVLSTGRLIELIPDLQYSAEILVYQK